MLPVIDIKHTPHTGGGYAGEGGLLAISLPAVLAVLAVPANIAKKGVVFFSRVHGAKTGEKGHAKKNLHLPPEMPAQPAQPAQEEKMETRSLINSLADEAIREAQGQNCAGCAGYENKLAGTASTAGTEKGKTEENGPIDGQISLDFDSSVPAVPAVPASKNKLALLSTKKSDENGVSETEGEDTPGGYLAQFKASYLRHDLACAEEMGLAGRIAKGATYCVTHPKDKAAGALLDDLRTQATRLRQTIEWEVIQLHELEKKLLAGTAAKYICGTCYAPIVETCETCWPRRKA